MRQKVEKGERVKTGTVEEKKGEKEEGTKGAIREREESMSWPGMCQSCPLLHISSVSGR